MAKKFLSQDGVLYFWTLLKSKFVAQETGKGLSTNDYTTTEKSKLSGIAEGAEKNAIAAITVNGSAITPDVATRTAAITIPTKTSELTNDSSFVTSDALAAKGYQTASDVTNAITSKGYQTAAEVSAAINEKISSMTGVDFKIVTELPTTGTAGTFYLIANSGTGNNVYNEYIWVTSASKYELIGTTQPDLSGYVKTTDITELTNAEIDTIVAS